MALALIPREAYLSSDSTPRFDYSDRELVRRIGRSTYSIRTRGVMVPPRQLQCSHNGSVGNIHL